MPRPKAAIPREALRINIRPDVMAKLRLLCFSDSTVYGLAYGAMSRFVEEAVEEKLTRMRNEKETP